VNTTIRVDDAGRHQVGWTRTGIDWTPTGDPFDKPRDAIDYADALDRHAAANAVGQGAEIALRADVYSGDGVAEAQRASQGHPASRPGSDDLARLGPDRRDARVRTEMPVQVSASRAPAAVIEPPSAAAVRTSLAVPVPLEALSGGCALPLSASKDAGLDPSGMEPGLLSLGLA